MSVTPIEGVRYWFDSAIQAFLAPGRPSLPVAATDPGSSYDPATMQPLYYREPGMHDYGGMFAPPVASTADANRIAGIKPGVTRANYAGSIAWTNGPVALTDLNVTGAAVTSLRSIKGTGHRLENIYHAGDASAYTGTGQGGWFGCLDASCADIEFRHVTVRPQFTDDRIDGFYGHGYTAYRCLVEGTVDCFSALNPAANNLDVVLRGVWGGHNAWRSSDRGVHSDGTHNDWIQHHGSVGLTIDGFTIWGYKLNALNPANLASTGSGEVLARTTTSGALAAGSVGTIYLGNGVLEQTEAGGVYHSGGSDIGNGWVYGCNVGFFLKSVCLIAAHGGVHYPTNPKLHDVVFLNSDQKDNGGALHTYPLRIDSAQTINDVAAGTYPSGDTVSTLAPDAWNLRYGTADSTDPMFNVAAALRGTPIRIRSDVAA